MKNLFLLTFLLIFIQVNARQLLVPQNYNTIQIAIDSALNEDTIIVANGVYIENLIISAKEIFLTSNYLLTSNFEDIHNTIIDGSNPNDPDTTSTVRIINGCGPKMILQGFTIRGGQGTPFNLASNQIFNEGGGIVIQNSSPEIRFNYITDNHCLTKGGSVISSGAGGIHTFFDSAFIHNNIIEGNTGLYGNGAVINNSKGLFSNNLVYNNRGGSDFGAGGVMVFCTVSSTSCSVINNTIVSNIANGNFGGLSGRSGGLFNIECDNTRLKNNIIWGNYQKTGTEVDNSGGASFSTEYNISGNPLTGNNYVFNPKFLDSIFIVSSLSQSIDAGDTNTLYNDIENSGNPGFAAYPSQGALNNDLGIYGGPFATTLPIINSPIYYQTRNNFNFLNPSQTDTINSIFDIRNLGSELLQIDSIKSKNGMIIIHFDTISNEKIHPVERLNVNLKWTPLTLSSDTILIFHNDSSTGSPSKISFSIQLSSLDQEKLAKDYLVYPNPTFDYIQVSSRNKNHENQKILIYDSMGNIQFEKKLNSPSVKLDLSQLKPGVYYYSIRGSINEMGKIIKL